MRNQLLLAFLFISITVQGQSFSFSSDFLPLEQVPCPFDPNIQISKPAEWLIYQTTDGLWGGSVDSARCIAAEYISNGNGIKIALDNINPEKPVFLRFEAGSILDYPLDSNQTFNVLACVDQYPDSLLFSTGSNCEEGICSGLFIGIAIPDSTWLPYAATRYQTALADKNWFYCVIESCFPTENFEEQSLRQLVLKFSFPTGANLSGKHLNLSLISINSSFFTDLPGMIFQVEASSLYKSGNEYNVPAYAATMPLHSSSSYLMRYNAATYPSPEHQAYVEAAPIPNSATPQIINLIVHEYENLEIQPFTNFRGGLVAGSDSIRHTANLVNMGGELCLNFIDLIFSGGDEFRHGGGGITFNHPRSCMQFRDGSKLRVLEGATLHYGNEGAGMLVVCADAGIAIERNATLIVDGVLSLSECNDNTDAQQVEMDLPPGASLIFTENALLTNQFSQFQQTSLRVRMLGGTLDDRALSPEERALIQREYPAASPVFDDNIQTYPNPFSEKLVINYLAGEDETIVLRWLNLDGRTLKEEAMDAAKGPNEWQSSGPKGNGVYLLVLESSAGRAIRKVLKE